MTQIHDIYFFQLLPVGPLSTSEKYIETQHEKNVTQTIRIPCIFTGNVVTLQPVRCSVYLHISNPNKKKYNITIKKSNNAYYSTIGKKGQKRSS